MCECGCVANDRRYTFQGPEGFMYVLTLSNGCVSCDAGSYITIEKISMVQFRRERREGFFDGGLELRPWRGAAQGVAIITGHRKHEFVKALLPQLVGFSIGGMCDNDALDEVGAEVLLEDLYDDARFKPYVQPPAEGGKG